MLWLLLWVICPPPPLPLECHKSVRTAWAPWFPRLTISFGSVLGNRLLKLESARVLQRPLSDFVARMGWDLTTPRDESFALLTQMGEIRALESAARRRARRL